MATSFVEEAILRVKDQSTTKINRINSALTRLRKTARGNIKIGVTGLPDPRRLSTFVRQVERLHKMGPVKLTISTAGVVPTINKVRELNKELRALRTLSGQTIRTRPPGGPGAPVGARGGRGAGFGSVYAPFPGNVPAVTNFAVAHMVVHAGRMTVRAAGRAGLEYQAEETRQEIFIPDAATRNNLRSIATQAVLNSKRVSETRANQIATDLYVSGFRGDNLRSATSQVTALEGQALLIAPKAAQQITALANKIGNLANVTEDSARQQEILEATYKAAIVQGESFNAKTMLAALRQTGMAGTMSQQGLVGFALAVDALGQRSGSAMARLSKELTTPLEHAGAGSGIAKGAVKGLMRTGIRGSEGLSERQARAFSEDPIKFIQTEIAKAFTDAGVDITDRVAVRTKVARSGFSITSQRLIIDALSAMEETAKQRELAARLDFSAADEAAMDDLGAAIKNLTEAFDTFSARILVPIFKTIAPHVDAFAQYLERVAIAGNKMDQWAVVGAAGLAGIATLFGTAKLTSFLMGGTKLTAAGVTLTTAGAELITAAQMLKGASVTGGKGGKGGAGKTAATAATGAAASEGVRKSAVKSAVKKTVTKALIPGAGVAIAVLTPDEAKTGIRPGSLIQTEMRKNANQRRRARMLLDSYADNPSLATSEEKSRAYKEWMRLDDRQAGLRGELIGAVLTPLDLEDPGHIMSAVRELTGYLGSQQEAVAEIKKTLEGMGVRTGPITSPRPKPRVNPGDLANPIVEILDVPERLGSEMTLAMGDGTAQLINAANVFGPTVGEGILQFAPQIGEAIAAYIRESIVALPVAATGEPTLGAEVDTGANTPF